MYVAVSPASNVPVLEPLSDPENEGPVLIVKVALFPSVRVSLTVTPVRVTLPIFFARMV